jgi:hypothetical protein
VNAIFAIEHRTLQLRTSRGGLSPVRREPGEPLLGRARAPVVTTRSATPTQHHTQDTRATPIRPNSPPRSSRRRTGTGENSNRRLSQMSWPRTKHCPHGVAPNGGRERLRPHTRALRPPLRPPDLNGVPRVARGTALACSSSGPTVCPVCSTGYAAMLMKVTGTTSSRASAAQGSVPKQVVKVTVPVPWQGSCNAVGIDAGVL